MLNSTKKLVKRAVAMLLCAMLLLGAVPADILPRASAASWADPYMDRLKQYGVMVDGRASDKITRAEMAAVLNRAFGFRRTGPIPFTDVPRNAWYYNDIVVSYNEGILAGTSNTTASPNSPVTREQALALIGRCLRYDRTEGEVTDFNDGQNFSNWSSIYVRAALLAGIINGNSGSNFRPKSSATRGEIASMLSIAMGELVNTSGVTELGGVFGNVTINSPDVTLRNTTIAGDLYLTGGVGLGNVILDNVKVLGRIIVAGGGEAQSGEASVLLNNVTAHKLLVDPATGQYVSLRALGNTDIPETVVKSNAYIQDDVRNNSMGLRKVIFEAPAEGRFTIAGNMKDVTLKAPDSLLIVGDTGTGSVTQITVDEEATNARVDLEINASVDDIKLDTSSTITGTGDIGHIDVGANGCTSEILPDSVTVRPGVVTEIAGITNIDSEVAKELSQKPRLLEGYPKVKNIAPTSADVFFSTNKAGTLYWALTDAARGPLTDSDVETLVEQPSYGSGFRQMGTIEIGSSKTEHQMSLADLTQGGTYYISATLVDAHGRRSQVKAQRITTPDGSVPAMANKEYPYITDATPTRNDENADLDFSEIANLQATVMANKSCDLYYVLLAAGSTAPSTNELLSAAFPNPYGYGRLHLIKNTLDSFRVSDIDLDLDGVPEGLGEVKESTSYDLYYWLTDADGEQSSQVQKITVTTKDITPPEFTMGEMFQSDTKANSVTLSNSVNEDATVYWVAVESGSSYPRRDPEVYPGSPEWASYLATTEAKLQVASGSYGLQSGSLTAKANTQFNFTVTGLERESAYDVYYVALDQAQNYSKVIGMYTAHTLDDTPPTASQTFESYPDDSPDTPYASSTINVVFSEAIRYRQPSSATDRLEEVRLIELYTRYRDAKASSSPGSETYDKAEKEFTTALRDMIILYSADTNRQVPERTASSGDDDPWVVDYRNVQVYQEGKNMVVSFVNDPANPDNSALNLESGAQYYFHLQNIADDSQSRNPMGTQDLDPFTTVSARVSISKLNDLELKAYKIVDDEISDEPISVYNDVTTKVEGTKTEIIPIDIGFTATPESTGTSADGVMWDMLFWFDTDVEFELYTRETGTTKWVPVGTVATDSDGINTVADSSRISIIVPSNKRTYTGASVTKSLTGSTSSALPQYQQIKDPYKLGLLYGGLNNDGDETKSYDFALHFTKVGTRTDRASFNQRIEGQVTFVTGGASSLNSITPSNIDSYDNVVAGVNGVNDITWPHYDGATEVEPRLLWKQFEDGRAPVMQDGFPKLTPTSSGVNAVFTMTSPGTVYYVMAPLSGDGYTLNPQRNEGGTAKRVPLTEITDKVPACNSFGPIANKYGVKYTMASDLSIFDRMFPGEKIPDDYKFDFPISSNITNPSSSDVASSQLVTGSVRVTRSDEDHLLSGLQPNTEYLMYLVTTTGTSGVYSPVTVYRFKTTEVVKPIITTQATGANATINSDLEANLVYKLLQYDSNITGTLNDPFNKSGYTNETFRTGYVGKPSSKRDENNASINYDSDKFTVLDALLETITVDGTRISFFDVCASETLKEEVAQIIDGTRPDGGQSLGVKQGTIKDSLSFMCDEVWKDMGNGTYCLLVYGYCGTGQNQSGKSFSAAQPITKRREQIKVNVSNGLYFTPDDYNNPSGSGKVGGSLTLSFTDALHYWTKVNGVDTRVPLYNVPMNYNGGTGSAPVTTSQSIQNHMTCHNDVQFVGAADTNWGQPLRDITLNFSGTLPEGISGRNFTVSLNGSYAGTTSDAQENSLILIIRVNTNNEVVVTASPSNTTWLAAPIS